MKFLPLGFSLLLASALVIADDGQLQSKNVSKTPDLESDHASIQQLWFNVPAQSSDGTLLKDTDAGGIEYYEPDGVTLIETREYARPLVTFYIDGHVDPLPEDAAAFYGHGERDFYAALSLDDGATWNRSNLSRSADKSSISIQVPFKKKTKAQPYPGDVFRSFTAAAGNKVLGVWASRYCNGGNPNYSLTQDEIDVLAGLDLAPVFFGEYTEECSTVRGVDGEPSIEDLEDCAYFADSFGVAGSQKIKDFEEEGFPTVGQVPYACLWTARGTLEPVDDNGDFDPAGDYHTIIWRQPERLTSGRRDVHRMEAACVGGAGCVVTWQEDPDGLRPGEGEGPGEGWSGAVAHHETDVWYAFLDWEAFDKILDEDAVVELSELTTAPETLPQAAIPFSIPMRLTDNAMCTDLEDETDIPYCYMDLDEDGDANDVCTTSVDYLAVTPDSAEDQNIDMCVAEDGRLMRGNTASTRARTNLRGYDSDGDGSIDSGWVIMAYEENKGLGEEDDDPADKLDMGKNIWYHTFDMFKPELVSQGLLLNQPAIYPTDVDPNDGGLVDVPFTLEDVSGYKIKSPAGYFAKFDVDPIYEVAGLADTVPALYQTEIARRYSQITQPASWVGDSGTVAFAMYKQGIVRRGGPADVFARRFVLPDGFDAAADNPFDYDNMECASWQFTDGSNPRYVKGLCMSSPINLSGMTVIESDPEIEDVPYMQFPFDDLFSDIAGGDDVTDITLGDIPKVEYWLQCGADGEALYDGADACPPDADGYSEANLDDQSWENPFDVAKGHRGFMYGDFIMAMYAWSPNWKDNAKGTDIYNLYQRRSFDGGLTWTTWPGGTDFLPSDIALNPELTIPEPELVTHCEWYKPTDSTVTDNSGEDPVCYEYDDPGEFEQARNLSQLTGIQMTVLDPRYAPTDPSFLGNLVLLMEGATWELIAEDGAELPGAPAFTYDYVDPTRYFVTFEEGDTEGIEEGEAEPMDMYYARGIRFGDHFEVADDEDGIDGTADIVPVDDDGFYETFDKLECAELHAAEAALKASPDGMFMYAAWTQWAEADDGIIYDSDAIVRRVMELDDGYDEGIYPGVTLPSGGCGTPGGSDDDGDDDPKPPKGKK